MKKSFFYSLVALGCFASTSLMAADAPAKEEQTTKAEEKKEQVAQPEVAQPEVAVEETSSES
jgi:hypothetical protein